MKPKDLNKELAIIDQTLNIVSETGIAGLKMSKLAKRVGISPSTLYVYFKTKEDLIVSIGFKILKMISVELGALLDDSKTFDQNLKAKWIHMLNFHLNHEKELNFMESWMQSPFFDKKTFKTKGDKFRPKTNIFDEGKKQGILKDLSDGEIHAINIGLAKQYASLIKKGQLKLDKTTIDRSFGVLRDALKK